MEPRHSRIPQHRNSDATACLFAVVALAATAASAREWQQGLGGPPPTAAAASAYDATRGLTVVFGGYDDDQLNDETAYYDGATWSPGPAAPAGLSPRAGAAMAFDAARGTVVLFGGWAIPTSFDDTWLLDENGWRQGPSAPAGMSARGFHTMVYDSLRQKVVLFGGQKWSALEALGDVWEWDGTSWSQGPPAPVTRMRAAATFDEDRDVMVVCGGHDENGQQTSETLEYDGTTWSQGPTSPMPPRSGAGAAFDATRHAVVFFGGYSETLGLLNDTWLYDGTTWNAGPAAPLDLFERQAPAVAYDAAQGRVVLSGGAITVQVFNDTWELGPAGWEQTLTYPIARAGHVMTYDFTRGVGILYGGTSSYGDQLSDTWSFDGESWVRLEAASPPGPRTLAAFTYDYASGKTILYGGLRNGTDLGDLWQLDALGWSQLPDPPAALTPRYGAMMACNPLRNTIVFFGGYSQADGYHGDTWEFSYVSGWSLKSPPPPTPSPRRSGSMVFDTTRGAIYLFGGWDDTALGDTWRYDILASTWTEEFASTPGLFPRLGHTVSHDSLRGRLVLFGGAPDADPDAQGYSDTWELDATGWTATATAPVGRSGHSSYFDPIRGRVVVFGGATDGRILGDTWEYGTFQDAVAPGAGFGPPNPNRVRLFGEDAVPTAVDFLAYGAGTWGATARAAHTHASFLSSIVTGPGPGPVHGPQVRAFVASGTPYAKVNFYAYGTLRYGVDVAGIATDADEFEEIVTGAGPGNVFGPHVRGFDVDAGGVRPISGLSFFAYQTMQYGVRVGGGDVEGDGFAEILTGPGPGSTFASQVRGFDVDGGAPRAISKIDFWAFPSSRHGVEVAAGDVDGDAFAEVAAANGPDPAAGATYQGFDYDGTSIRALPGFSLGPSATTRYGGRLALLNVEGAASPRELVGAPGPDPAATPAVAAHAYDGAALTPSISFDAFTGLAYGANLGGGDLTY